MRIARRTKRLEDVVLPGDFRGFDRFQDGDPEGDGCLRGTIRRADGRVELGEVALEWHPDRKRSFTSLKFQAEQLSRRVTYLEGHLEIVDLDREGLYIQLRSLPPYKDDQQIQFNEICIEKNRIALKRIALSRRDDVKQQVPLRLQEADWARLLADLRNAVGAEAR